MQLFCNLFLIGLSNAIRTIQLQINFRTNPKEDRNINIKWFAILTGIGMGLTIINYTLPLGIHPLAIIAFSIAASFLGYFLFLKQDEKIK